MITLHESNITSFPLDNGIGVLSDAIVAYTEEELNGMFEFYMEYDSEGHLVDELKEERIIKAKAQDKLGYQLFRIYSITKNHENDNLIVNAQHITYDLANNFVEELKANRLTKKQVMEKIGSSTVLPHTFNVTSSNTTTISSTSLYRTNPLQMIAGMEGSVLQIWGGQIERDNFNLILHDRRGHDDGVTVTYEKNITGLVATFDISSLVTRIFPYVFIEATDDTPERLITVNGKYIDSPHINDYEVIRTEPIDYSNDNRIDTQDKTDAQIRQQLEHLAKDYFKETGNDKIKYEMEVQFAHLWEAEEYKDVKVLELVGMGDTVTTNHSKLKVNATAIVNYIKYDCIAQVNEEVKLGSVKARLTDSINKIDSIEKKVEQAESNANQAIVSANGKNTTFYGPDEPVEGMQKGDLWFKVIDGQYHKTYRYDGIEWQLIIDMDSQEAKEQAQQAKVDAQSAVDRANQATQQATNAINQAQTAFDSAQESLTLGQGLTSRMSDAEGNLTVLNQTTQSLAGRLSDTEGNLTTLTATVSGLQTTVSDIDGNVANLTVISNAMQARL
ncbi:MAG TPA: phage tail spike protein [Cerasibacillus sp.]|uniref:phage tail spike protein n=1 Tax=Cerasibacillus sp. TaxID=2498711 RepID=UPI002F40D301